MAFNVQNTEFSNHFAFEFAENNKIQHNFNQLLHLAGVDWF